MLNTKTVYISPIGGSIVCFSKANNRLFQSCSKTICRFSRNLHSAKKILDTFESRLPLLNAYKFE